jgi:hypothetical protein
VLAAAVRRLVDAAAAGRRLEDGAAAGRRLEDGAAAGQSRAPSPRNQQNASHTSSKRLAVSMVDVDAGLLEEPECRVRPAVSRMTSEVRGGDPGDCRSRPCVGRCFEARRSWFHRDPLRRATRI